MPGNFCHLALAEEVYRQLSSYMPLDKIKFMSGNLIPDLAIVDKKISHFRKGATIKGLFVPDMAKVEKELFAIDDTIKLGMYCHLYFDYSFIENFLIPEFEWPYERMKIVNPRNHMEWDPEPFFKKDGVYYQGFNEINHLLISDGCISIKTISELPEDLPNTGMEVFDVRCEKTWKAEFEEYLNKKEEYTGNIFNYDRLKRCIQKTSDQLVKKIIAK